MSRIALKKPSSTEARYGFFGALVAALISLVPWVWPHLDLDERLQKSVENGFDQVRAEPNLARKLRYLDQIDQDLELSWAYERGETSKRRRKEIEQELADLQKIENARQLAQQQEQEKLANLRAALEASQAAEKLRLQAELDAALVAEREREKADVQRAKEQQRVVEELVKISLAEEERREEARRAALIEAERQWRDERICQNRNCTSWIIP